VCASSCADGSGPPLDLFVEPLEPIVALQALVGAVAAEFLVRSLGPAPRNWLTSASSTSCLRTLLLRILQSIRSERMLAEQSDDNLLFDGFVGTGNIHHRPTSRDYNVGELKDVLATSRSAAR
jgi:hypothetical protein